MQGVITEKLKHSGDSQRRKDCPLIIGNTPEMVRIKKLIPELNRLNETILVQGERGTGKDLLARVIYTKSDRRNNPLIKVHIPELFREYVNEEEHDKDEEFAFRTENGDLREILSLADKGTLFLDEIGAMTPTFQAELLYFFKDTQILGSEQGNQGIRIIASTSADLESLVADGQFRKDLYYRLNVIKIKLPPLRMRIEDIPQLADFFTDTYCRKLDKSHYELSDETKKIFCRYLWPANVRELEILVKNIVSQENEEELVQKLYLHSENENLLNNVDSPFSAEEIAKVKKYLEASNNLSLKDVSQKYLNRVEKRLVKKALDSTNWNRRRAAAILDISYKSLLNKIKYYELTDAR